MRTEAARKAEFLATLAREGERLAQVDAASVRGPAAIPALVGLLEDEDPAVSDAPGSGYAARCTVKLLRELGAVEAIEPMFRLLARCEPLDWLYSDLVDALQSFGPRALEQALAAHAAARTRDERLAVADVASGLGVRDDRILPILLRALREDVVLGADLLGVYGDPATLPHLGATLDECQVDSRGGPAANQDVVELRATIEKLGGSLSQAQQGKVDAARAAREAARTAHLTAAAADHEDERDDGEEDPDGEVEREEVLRRFSESTYAGGECDPGWVELSLRYGAEYEGVSFSGFDARLLRKVVFELIPRKVSCEAAAAPAIVHSLRAFWTFARDVLGHAHAQACLEELGDEAIPDLARRLADPSNFGMAKSFVMTGRGRGFRVDSEEGLRQWSETFNAELAAASEPRRSPHGGRDDSRRKKRMRKMRKRAQRRNRR